MSHARAAALGWTRIDAKPWTKLHARWRHKDGWELHHCGHPTANHPWALYDPQGLMHCTGAQRRFGFKPENGTAWDTLEDAMTYVQDPAPRGDPTRPMPGKHKRRR